MHAVVVPLALVGIPAAEGDEAPALARASHKVALVVGAVLVRGLAQPAQQQQLHSEPAVRTKPGCGS